MRTADKAKSIAMQADMLHSNVSGYAAAYKACKGDWFKMWGYARGTSMSRAAILADIRKLRRDLLTLSREIEEKKMTF